MKKVLFITITCLMGLISLITPKGLLAFAAMSWILDYALGDVPPLVAFVLFVAIAGQWFWIRIAIVSKSHQLIGC